MQQDSTRLLRRFHRVLVDEIRTQRPELLAEPFTVAEIYQTLIPYRTHRDRLGVDMNGDYEDVLLRLLAGVGGYLDVQSEPAREQMESELERSNPNTGLFREFAAVDVRLNPEMVDDQAAPVEDDPVSMPGTIGVEPTPAPPPGDSSAPAADDLPEAPTPSVDSLAPSGEEAGTGGGVGSAAAEAGHADGPADGGEARSGEEAAGATCRWCRADLPERADLNFCPFCGTDVNMVPCPSCGQELEPEWLFCISCGTEVPTD